MAVGLHFAGFGLFSLFSPNLWCYLSDLVIKIKFPVVRRETSYSGRTDFSRFLAIFIFSLISLNLLVRFLLMIFYL